MLGRHDYTKNSNGERKFTSDRMVSQSLDQFVDGSTPDLAFHCEKDITTERIILDQVIERVGFLLGEETRVGVDSSVTKAKVEENHQTWACGSFSPKNLDNFPWSP